MALAALETLPAEIIHLISSHLGFHCREQRLPELPDAYLRGDRQKSNQPSWYSLKLQTLLSLCLVSSHLCNAVQPILYHEFSLGYGDSWRSDLYTWNGRLTSFMRTVAQRREYISEDEIQDVLREAAQALQFKELQQKQYLSAGDLVTVLITELPDLQHCSHACNCIDRVTAVTWSDLDIHG